ncbi:MAG: cytochrome c oxidase assembly protein [Ilumatobacteraceae bacterium]
MNPAEHVALVLVGVVAVAVYGWAWLHLPEPRRRTWRLWAWAGGVFALAVSTSAPVERLADESFTGHMVQHLLMIIVAAPLLVVARPVRTLGDGLQASPRTTPTERRVARWWRTAGPVIAPAAFLVVLFVTHLTGIYDEALQNRFVHDAEHLAYLLTAVALWAVVRSAGRASAPGRVAAVFAVIGGSALLGVVLLTASTPLIDTYATSLGTADALDDQRAAASLMWVGGMALTLPLLVTSVWRWANAEQRAAERLEALGVGEGRPT